MSKIESNNRKNYFTAARIILDVEDKTIGYAVNDGSLDYIETRSHLLLDGAAKNFEFDIISPLDI